jgi:hypothetical protein
MERTQLLTDNATFDILSDEDYRQMFRSIRGYYRSPDGEEKWELGYTLFTREVGMDEGTKAEWARWYKKERGYGTSKPLPREYRNAIRRLYVRDGERVYPDLPATVADAIAQNTSPDARVSKYGEGPADEVILLSGCHGSVTLSINSEVQIYQDDTEGAVPDGTTPPRPYREAWRPMIPTDRKELAKQTGLSVIELLDFAIEIHSKTGWY